MKKLHKTRIQKVNILKHNIEIRERFITLPVTYIFTSDEYEKNKLI